MFLLFDFATKLSANTKQDHNQLRQGEAHMPCKRETFACNFGYTPLGTATFIFFILHCCPATHLEFCRLEDEPK